MNNLRALYLQCPFKFLCCNKPGILVKTSFGCLVANFLGLPQGIRETWRESCLGSHRRVKHSYTWVFRGHFFLDFPVSSKNNAHFIQKRSIRNKTLNWKVVLVRVRTFPLISRRFPLISRRFPLIFWDTTCKSRFPLIFSFSAQNLKRAKKMPRAPKSDQMEDPGMYKR